MNPESIDRGGGIPMHIGAHLSIANGYAHAARTALEIGGTVFQFFSRNPRGSRIKTSDPADIAEFQSLRPSLGPLLAHAPYTLNLASGDARVSEFARNALREDLLRMDALDIEYFNVHPGSHTGAGEETGVERTANAISAALAGCSGFGIALLLEAMSGKGSEIGYRFQQLHAMIDRVEAEITLGVCLDLCHVYAAGYDIVGRLDAVLDEFDAAVGLHRLKAIHLNDSMAGLGERKDRHAAIGSGAIGFDAALRILTHPQLRDLPFYLETPLDESGHSAEIAMIKEALKRN